MTSLLPRSLSHSSFPSSQFGLQPKPFLSMSELSFYSVYKGQRERGRRNPAAFTVYCRVLLSLSYIQKSLSIAGATTKRGYFQLLVKQTSVDNSTETAFSGSPHFSHMYSVSSWRSLEKLREKDINISKSYILEGSVPAEKAHIARLLQTFQHFGFGLMDNLKYIFCWSKCFIWKCKFERG